MNVKRQCYVPTTNNYVLRPNLRNEVECDSVRLLQTIFIKLFMKIKRAFGSQQP